MVQTDAGNRATGMSRAHTCEVDGMAGASLR
jgi:hypothetical protein